MIVAVHEKVPVTGMHCNHLYLFFPPRCQSIGVHVTPKRRGLWYTWATAGRTSENERL
ncbi:hypothetical protein Plhal304r1_c042g0120611 [Plasmopara halstedii]